MKTEHSVDIACLPDSAFEIGLRVDDWPEIFPPCLAARVLDETDDCQRIALTARANDAVLSWESVRTIDRARRTISFAQSRPSPLVRYMTGSWRFEPKDNGTCVTLTHEYEIAEAINGHVDGVANYEDAACFMLSTIETNSKKELEALRSYVERRNWQHQFEESHVIGRPSSVVMQLLRDAAAWPSLLPHCNTVDMIYEDNAYQEFIMTVSVGETMEHIRSIRVLLPDRIEYFQPAPPPALREHRGRWTLCEGVDCVTVTSWHDVVLDPAYWGETTPDEAKARVATAINRNSLGTMHAIAAKLAGPDNA